MPIKRIALRYSDRSAWHVPMFVYEIVPGSFLPIVPGMITADGICADCRPDEVLGHRPTALIEFPDSVRLNDRGQIDAPAIRKQYNYSLWYGCHSYIPPLLLGDT